MPNAFAYLVLLSSPVVVWVLFRFMSLPNAIVASIIGGYLFLPARPSFDLPILPALTKETIPAITAMIFALVAVSATQKREAQRSRIGQAQGVQPIQALPGLWPKAPVMIALLALLVLGGVGQVLTNSDPIYAGGDRFLPGLSPYDFLNLLNGILFSLFPFILAWKFLGHRDGQIAVLAGFAIGALLYVLPVLAEIRLSPQLNTWIYGFFPHSFVQHMRGDGFRPVVFLNHGLWLGIFMCMGALACFGMRSASKSTSTLAWISGGLFLTLVLLMSRSLGAFLILLVLLPVAWFFPARIRLLIAAVVVAFSMLLPALRVADVFSTAALVNVAQKISFERAQSLEFRFDNENLIIEKAREKPIFGWGGWGRGFIYDEQSGQKLTTVDSQWIIYFNSFGWVGILGFYGLLGVPMFILAFRSRERGATPETAALAVVLAANMTDTLVNGTVTPVTWLLAGTLAGAMQHAAQSAPKAVPARAADTDEAPPTESEDTVVARRYTRQTKVHRRTSQVRRPAVLRR